MLSAFINQDVSIQQSDIIQNRLLKHEKGRFKLSTPTKCTLLKGKALIEKVLKFKTFYVQEIRF